MANNSTKIKIIVLIIISIFLFFQFREREKDEERIKQNHIVYCGTISSIGRARGGLIIKYEFSVEGELRDYNGGCTKYTENRFKSGISHNIFVVTEKGNPNVNRLLESIDDFEKYQIISKDTIGLNCSLMDY